MDDFGIGAAPIGSFRVLLTAFRGTGRTTRMIERYQEGDRIVFATGDQARYAMKKAKDQGKTIRYVVVDPTTPEQLFERRGGPSEGKTIFDHVWLELHYENEIRKMVHNVQYLQNQASGPGEPHRKTREAANMMNKWKI